MQLVRCTQEIVEAVIEDSLEGRNTKFLNSSHSLWFRFKNYDKNPPFALEVDGELVAFVFATYSQRSRYINLYEIVTRQGQEGKGYATIIWEQVMADACDNGMTRLKLSCTPSSVTWHKRNGLVFWAVDPTGSLRSDQPLFATAREQRTFRATAIKMPHLATPTDAKVVKQLTNESLESHGFGKKKTATVEEAIAAVGEYWMRDKLIGDEPNTLEGFF